jgi:hypothetical protein
VMAGDWIKMRSNLDTDPRIIAMASALNIPELHIVGCCWKIWAWADSHTPDGNLQRVTDVTLDRFTGVTGFATALRAVGWLAGNDQALSLPKFTEHNGHTAKKRAETAMRVANHRKQKSVTSVTSKVLPEKRREEKSINTPKSPKGTEEYSPEFLKFWEIFPPRRKDKKRATWKAWQSAIKRKAAEDILAAAGEYAASPKGRGEFCSGPVPWLNGDCWDDDRRSWSDGKQGDLFGQRPAHPNEPIPTRTGKVDWRNPGTT